MCMTSSFFMPVSYVCNRFVLLPAVILSYCNNRFIGCCNSLIIWLQSYRFVFVIVLSGRRNRFIMLPQSFYNVSANFVLPDFLSYLCTRFETHFFIEKQRRASRRNTRRAAGEHKRETQSYCGAEYSVYSCAGDLGPHVLHRRFDGGPYRR